MQTGSIHPPDIHSQPSNVAPNGTREARTGRGRELSELPHDDTYIKPTGHTGKLVYARPQDLPSFPSIGLSKKGSAASAAATLGWANKKSPELWKPEKSASASAAAVMAKDYKLAPAWEPVASSHGAKAALLAAQSAKSTGAWKPSPTDHGQSAATIAFNSNRSTPRTSRANTLEREKSLLAAKGAMTRRPRALSSPASRESYPDEANAAANALSAATRAHKPPQSPAPSHEAGAVPYTTMNRQMFTSKPPVKPEVDEQRNADILHASAVAMAKKMYVQQQKMIDAKKAQHNAGDHLDVSSSISDDAQPAQLTTLQDAAYKQAQARLAKMHQDNIQNRDYQEYYGAKQPSRRFSVKNKLRRRSSSDGAAVEDHKRSQQIRQQMSLFSNKLSQVDDKKRQHDQEALLAAAQRNVHARLKGMDEKISAETGMVPPSTLTQWELKAHAAAQSRSNERSGQQHGRIDIGAGKYMEQDDIDAIAARRVQPLLDEINEKAEKEHARQTELRLEMERKKEEEEIEKARQKEIEDISKKLKEQDKQEQKERRAEEKQEAKAKKDEEKAARAEQRQLAKSVKRKSGGHQPREDEEESEEAEATRETVTLNSSGQPVSVPLPETEASDAPARGRDVDDSDMQSQQPGERSPPGKMKTWFRSRFSRGRKSPDRERSKDKAIRKSFIGGATLTGAGGNESSTSLDNRSASVRAVAMAGIPNSRRTVSEDRSFRHGNAGAVSPLSSESDEEYFRDEARDQVSIHLTPPTRAFSSSTKSQSPSRDSRFHEII